MKDRRSTKEKIIDALENKKKVIEINIDKKACAELDEIQEKCFGHLSKEMKKALGIKKHKPQKLKALFG